MAITALGGQGQSSGQSREHAPFPRSAPGQTFSWVLRSTLYAGLSSLGAGTSRCAGRGELCAVPVFAHAALTVCGPGSPLAGSSDGPLVMLLS